MELTADGVQVSLALHAALLATSTVAAIPGVIVATESFSAVVSSLLVLVPEIVSVK